MLYIVLNVKLTLSSLQLTSLGKQCNQSSCVAPSITNKDPGNSGNRIKLGGPFFLRNSNTRTAPRETTKKGDYFKVFFSIKSDAKLCQLNVQNSHQNKV